MKKAKQIVSLLLVLCMVIGMIPAVAAAGTLPFSDVNILDWFYDEVRFTYENGLMSGTGAGKFSPNATTTRGMIVTILFRVDGEPEAYYGEDFTDVEDGDYYANAVAWAGANGVVTGYGSGKFGPNDPITREQLATILYRYAQFCLYDISVYGDLSGFADDEKVSVYAVEAMKWAVGTGLISGTTGNRLDPAGTATRAQVATILSRFCGEYDLFTSGTVKLPMIQVPTTGEKTAADEYYENHSQLIDVIDVEESEGVLSETEVKTVLESRGFDAYPITYEYSMSGDRGEETEVLNGSTVKHPMYQTFYVSQNGEVWVIYVINGEVFANPVSFNLESDLGAQLLVSVSEQVTSYDDEGNKFYITIPNASEIIIKTVNKIDAETLDRLTVEEICKLSGATVPPTENEETESDEPVTTCSLNAPNATTSVTAIAEQSDDPIIVVSLGDSYSSGEGIEPFYGQEKSVSEKVKDNDWLAHRSTKSWPSLLKIPGVAGTMGDYKVKIGDTSTNGIQWYFGAVSGAETKHFKNEFKKEYDQNIGSWYEGDLEGSKKLPPQLDVFDNINGDVDYVTLTIGGNDVDFAGIVTTCAINCTYIHWGSTSKLDDQLTELWNNISTTMAKIKQVYEDIEDGAGPQAAIIVAGYPKLLDKNGEGKVINKDEARRVNEKVTAFNDKIEALVSACAASGMNIHFVDVETEFDKDGGHQAYSPNAWINGVVLPARGEDLKDDGFVSAYSIHPNEKGAKAYARAVNAKIEEIENNKRRKTVTGIITIADTDTDMTNNVPLEGATIEIELADFMGKIATSNSRGEYILTDIPHGAYTVTVSKDGFIPVTETITIGENDTEIIYNITIEAISEDYEGVGFANGTIYDAGTGLGVPDGITLYVRRGIGNTSGNVVLKTYTTTNGTYSTAIGLEAGNYTVEVVDERTDISEEQRYTTASFHIKILGGQTIGNQNGYVSNGVTTDEIRVVLTWGASPRDLDSHLVGPTSNGNRFHVYYGDKVYGTEADLDVDDTSSYGPETVTIHSFNEGIYTYAVHDYSNKSSSNSTALAASGAQVKVYRGAELLATYNVPANMDGTLWTVFTYNSRTKQIKTVNTMSYDSSSGGSLMSTFSLTADLMLQDEEVDEATSIIYENVRTDAK